MSGFAPAAARMLPDGRRLHLHHGPIDLIVEAFGRDRAACLAQARARFVTVLEELVGELPALRRPVSHRSHTEDFTGPTARRMTAAARRHAGVFVTPMAAVAGAVADEVLAAMVAGRDIDKAYVNNGGDVAFHLTPGASAEAAGAAGPVSIQYEDRARGLATSGWRGRSHSLGIADAVTVAARDAAAADIATTLIANAVDLPGHPAISRAPARALSPDSDLGDRLVTTDVGALSAEERRAALARGATAARAMQASGLIVEAALTLQGAHEIVAAPDAARKRSLSHA